MRLLGARLSALALLASTAVSAEPLSLEAVIQHALQSNPGIAVAAADQDLANAQVRQARAAALPQVSLVGQAAHGTADLGGFFGFGRQNVDPRSAALELRQPLFAGGAVLAGIDQAKLGRTAAEASVLSMQLQVAARAAEVYGAVLTARARTQQTARYVAATSEIARSAALRFEAGEIPRSDWAQAEAREADGQAQAAQAAAQLASAQGQFRAIVGIEPDELLPLPAVAAAEADITLLLARAEQNNPDLAAAQAVAKAAHSGVQMAQAERLPSLAMTARASTVRDEFLPGYASQGSIIGIQGKWTVFASGGTNARIGVARAAARRADAQLAQLQDQLRSAVLTTWATLRSSEAAVRAASAQLSASDQALNSLQHEVRAGQRTTLELLNAERDRLAAATSLAVARSALTTTAWQLAALTGR